MNTSRDCETCAHSAQPADMEPCVSCRGAGNNWADTAAADVTETPAMAYESRVLSMIVAPVGQPTFSELSTTISIDDEGGGEFITISQNARQDVGKVSLMLKEWPAVRAAIDQMMALCRDESA